MDPDDRMEEEDGARSVSEGGKEREGKDDVVGVLTASDSFPMVMENEATKLSEAYLASSLTVHSAIQVPHSKDRSSVNSRDAPFAVEATSAEARKKKLSIKKRNRTDEPAIASSVIYGEGAPSTSSSTAATAAAVGRVKKRSKTRRTTPGMSDTSGSTGIDHYGNNNLGSSYGNNGNPNHASMKDYLRRAFEEDLYSATGSIVDTDSDTDEGGANCSNGTGAVEYRGQVFRLDRHAMIQYAAKYLGLLGSSNAMNISNSSSSVMNFVSGGNNSVLVASTQPSRDVCMAAGFKKVITAKNSKSARSSPTIPSDTATYGTTVASSAIDSVSRELEEELDLDGSSIFGRTTGSSNFTWVECDKCKKWRRLRGIVDEKKLPSRWYCSMNKSDPERNRCSAPEEEYDANHTTPENAADARCRKHLRVWVRRLQTNDTYESRQPTLTRGKKKAQSCSKEPYEWVRCCNPSCGKWRCLLRSMDAKSVMDKSRDGEWYCVMNTWDEKVASCAAPQENLPAVGCPPWVLQDEAN